MKEVKVRKHKRKKPSGGLATVRKHTRRVETASPIMGTREQIIFKKVCKSCGKTFETPYLYAGKCPECIINPSKPDTKVITDVQFKIDADRFVEEYYRGLKLEKKPYASMSDLKIHVLSSIRGGHRIDYNKNLWLDYYEIDQEEAGKCLEFLTVHEMYHIRQREIWGRKRFVSEEDWADIEAQMRTGIKVSEFNEMTESLEMRRKMKERGLM